MAGSLYDELVLIDSSAVVALFDESEPFHKTAKELFENETEISWLALNVTSHETSTRVRYDRNLRAALGAQGGG